MKNTYREMKDCGVAWIGDIPQTWKKGRIKYNYFLKGRIGWQGLKADEFIEDGPYYLVTGTDFENGRIAWDRCYHISEQRFIEAPEIHIRKGDLLITKDGTVGKVALIDSLPHKASLNSHLLIVRPTSKLYDNVFLFWIFQSSIFEKYCGLSQNGSIMASLSQEKMSNFSFPLPSLHEQTAIAAYLDEKCAAIDEIIAEAKASIEEYKAWKSSVIFEAVTKGLDPHAEMKDSDVEWIGKVPKHWDVLKFKYIIKIKSGDAIRNELLTDKGSYPVYGGGELIGYTDNYNVCQNTILVGRVGARCGCVTKVVDKAWATDNALVVSTTSNHDYLHYLLLAANLNNLNTSNAQPLITATKINNHFIAYTSDPKEQDDIVAVLDAKCATIDGIIAEKEALIADMEAYKKSLIFETVTGKRKVC